MLLNVIFHAIFYTAMKMIQCGLRMYACSVQSFFCFISLRIFSADS